MSDQKFCQKCGSVMVVSRKGNLYCSGLCWIKEEDRVRRVYLNVPFKDLERKYGIVEPKVNEGRSCEFCGALLIGSAAGVVCSKKCWEK